MNPVPIDGLPVNEQDRLLHEAMQRDEPRLRSFIRRHVNNSGDVEDIVQDVFYELVEAYRMMKPIEHVTGWLFRVARNRIVDLFRGRRTGSLSDPVSVEEDGRALLLEDLLPSGDDGPEAVYARNVLMEALEEALEELPREQREVFLAHEVTGTSFKELAEQTGVSMNTLLSRKRYAVLHLRRRLEAVKDDFEM
ncbi:RNA polymerase sigma factor [Edaphobacter flagellatus]|uniref:RNA polymerase sigma factor n=1 Tax=Edaphobacter flagellatus TaxID=1933044 RepID=UPI0021B30087|nr:sigma-70 family RNA polymerase sigma factor [Edaphobacter flagellatus]